MIKIYKNGPAGITTIDQPEPGCWVSMIRPSQEEHTWLTNTLGVTDEYARAAFDNEESSYVDLDDDSGQALIIIDYPIVDDSEESEIDQYDTQPFSAIFVPDGDLIVTISLDECDILDPFAAGKVHTFDTRFRTRFLLQLFLAISQRYISYLRNISRQYAKTEKTLRHSLRNDELISMLGLEKSLLYFSTSLEGNMTTLEKIHTGRFIKLYEEDDDMIDSARIELQQATDMASINSSILSRTMETFASVINNNMNTVIRILTIITVVLAVPTMIFSFYGMNVDNLPFTQDWGFATAISIVVAVMVALILTRSRIFRK